MKAYNHVIVNDGTIHAFILPAGMIVMEDYFGVTMFWGFMWFSPVLCPYCLQQEVIN